VQAFESNVDVADNDFKLAFPDFQLCQSVKAIAKVEGTGRNPRPKGGPESGMTPEPIRVLFSLKELPRDDFNFGPHRTPLLETFSIHNR
jgi:hypothetical protein